MGRITRRGIQIRNLKKQLHSLSELLARLWIQACYIDGIDPKINGFEFSPNNIAAQRYAKLSQDFRSAETTLLMLTGRKRQSTIEVFSGKSGDI